MNPNFACPRAKTKSVKPRVATVTKRAADNAATATMMLMIDNSNLLVIRTSIQLEIFKDVIWYMS